MILQNSPFFIPLIISAIITGALAHLGWQNRKNPLADSFTLLMVATTLWTVCYALQMVIPEPIPNLDTNTIEYIGIVTVPVAWLLFVLTYTGREYHLTRRNVAALFIIPAFVVLLVATNPWHHLYYTAVTPVSVGGSVYWVYSRGPFFWLHVAYCYGISLFAAVLLASRYSGSPDLFKKQILLLLVASGLPILINILYIAGIDPVPGLDLTPFSFTLTGVLVVLGILRYHLFSMMPVAYPLIFSTISDAIIVTDAQHRVIDLNPAALQLTGGTALLQVGRSVTEILPALTPLFDRRAENGTEGQGVVELPDGGNTRYYDTVFRPIRVVEPDPNGTLVIMRDITDIRNAEKALKHANQKLSLVSWVTSHDIANKMTALTSYLELAREEEKDAVVLEYLTRMDSIAKIMKEMLDFSRDYQDMGKKEPAWQDVFTLVVTARSLFDRKGITIGSQVQGLCVYADPLFPKVIYNLIDNAFRHGGHVTEVNFSYVEGASGATLLCEDNGVGIAEEDKSRIFDRNFGKNTGLGLFLTREILGTTGLSITENGTPGAGARFAIFFPSGQYRIGATDDRSRPDTGEGPPA